MDELARQHKNYQRIAKAIEYISEHCNAQPELKDIAEHLHVSEHHLQRLFSEWAGISPKRFLQYLTKEHAKQLLRESTVLNTAHSLGLSSAGRLHDLMVNCEGMTPGEYQRCGQGMRIVYGIHPSPFGYCLIAVASRGICKLSFFDVLDDAAGYLNELSNDWSLASLEKDQDETKVWVNKIFSEASQDRNIPVLLKGTNFQLKVWEALLDTPRGALTAYNDVACKIGKPKAVRAVSSSIARNNVALLIPCHRVIRKTGELNQYRWGTERKNAMLMSEQPREHN